jgi:ferritin-like metal-binding protein YciE
LGNALRRPRDDFDRALKDLMTAIAVKHFKVAMYEALSALAAAAEDEDTVTLAQGHLTAEREGSARVERLIAPTAALAARASEEAAAEAQS